MTLLGLHWWRARCWYCNRRVWIARKALRFDLGDGAIRMFGAHARCTREAAPIEAVWDQAERRARARAELARARR